MFNELCKVKLLSKKYHKGTCAANGKPTAILSDVNRIIYIDKTERCKKTKSILLSLGNFTNDRANE